jgi:cyclic pyranopterin phosphate synthase
MTRTGALVDSHGRTLRDLRVSLTDRCNFRCLYCLPETEAAQNFYRGHWAHLPNPAPIVQQWVDKSFLLSFEELERVIRVAVSLGIQKIRLTGGEPLLRHGMEELVARIAKIPGIEDLAMTTNGFLFAQKARALREAGLRRVSFSLDSLDRANFKKITGRDGLGEVLESLRLARELGFHPVKVNAVVIREINDHELESLAAFAQEHNLSFRFIEFMPLDSARAWQKDMVVNGREILERLQKRFDLRPVASDNPSSTSKRWSFTDGRGEIGIIAPVSEPFCGHHRLGQGGRRVLGVLTVATPMCEERDHRADDRALCRRPVAPDSDCFQRVVIWMLQELSVPSSPLARSTMVSVQSPAASSPM